MVPGLDECVDVPGLRFDYERKAPVVDFVVPLIILLGVLGLMLWALGVRREQSTNVRIANLERQRHVDVSCHDAQARMHESRLVHLELRAFAASRDIVSLANRVADADVDPSDRKTKESPPPAAFLQEQAQ